jgi:hypothetical protein
VAYKFGYLDLSARIIDLMRVCALAVEGLLLVAALAYVRTETFFATGDPARRHHSPEHSRERMRRHPTQAAHAHHSRESSSRVSPISNTTALTMFP